MLSSAESFIDGKRRTKGKTKGPGCDYYIIEDKEMQD